MTLEEGVRPAVAREVFELLILMMAPMVPHLAEELWEMLGHTGETLALNFSSSLFEGKGTADESWGLDNVQVSTR